jgi:integrase
MARPTRDAKVDSKEARAKLPVRAKPYYRDLAEGLHLGYRKGLRKGAWVLRRKVAFGQYEVETIGEADDGMAIADGATVLNFRQAQAKARSAADAIVQGIRLASDGPVVTVKAAIEDYLAVREARERVQKGDGAGLRRDARSRLTIHVLDADEALSAKPLHELTSGDLAKWRKARAKSVGESTVRRAVNDFKAALNAAVVHNRKGLPGVAEEIKAGFKASGAASSIAREKQVLPDADIRCILAAAKRVDAAAGWEGDLFRLVAVLAATGARFSQVVRMRVADVRTAQSRLMVPVSAKGRGEKTRTHVAFQVGGDILEILRPAIAGRKGPDPLFLRPRWQQEKVGKWEKTGRAPWISPSELTRPWALIVADAGLPADVVPYALRHSSIVRGLGAGLPVRLVAALHDTSSAMIEKHYSAFIVDAMDELASRAVVPLVPQEPRPIRSVVG